MRIILIFFSFLVFGCVSKISKKSIRFIGIVNQQNTKLFVYKHITLQRAKLDKELLKDHNKPIAIVADLDETVLNNTPFNEMLLEEDLTYNQDLWSTWVNKKIATAVPGSIEFFNYASKKCRESFIYQIGWWKTISQLRKI